MALRWSQRKDKMDSNIADVGAIELFNRVCVVYDKKYKMDDIALHIINDIALLEQRKRQYGADIASRGIMTYWRNGNGQEGYREHPLLKEIPKLVEQQRRLLSEIKLTPAAMKITPTADESKAGDEFDAF